MNPKKPTEGHDDLRPKKRMNNVEGEQGKEIVKKSNRNQKIMYLNPSQKSKTKNAEYAGKG